jgi:hypothetical protein
MALSNISAKSWRPVLVNQKQELSIGSVFNGIKIKKRIRGGRGPPTP